MPIKYAPFESNITSDPDDYAAVVQISGNADGDDLVQDIIDQGSTVNKPDILAVTAALKLACQRRAKEDRRGDYDRLIREVVRRVQAHVSVTDAQRAPLGIAVRDAATSRRPPPPPRRPRITW